MSQSYTISELAREFDITTRTIRFYEHKELLKPTRVGTARVYSRADRTRLRLVLRGKRLGWQLNEIREIIDLYDNRTGDGQRKQLETMIEKLQSTRDSLLSQQQDIEESLAEIDELEANCLGLLDTANVETGSDDPASGGTTDTSQLENRNPGNRISQPEPDSGANNQTQIRNGENPPTTSTTSMRVFIDGDK